MAMLAVDDRIAARKLTPNLLPCAIKHSGPVHAQKHHWLPSPSSPDPHQPSVVFFRGRKLCGRAVSVPDGYRGALLHTTETRLPPKVPTAQHLRRVEEEDDGEGMDTETEMHAPAEVKMMQQLATFDHLMVWGHEAVPDHGDEYVKGVQEWIAFAEAVHSYQDSSISQDRT